MPVLISMVMTYRATTAETSVEWQTWLSNASSAARSRERRSRGPPAGRELPLPIAEFGAGGPAKLWQLLIQTLVPLQVTNSTEYHCGDFRVTTQDADALPPVDSIPQLIAGRSSSPRLARYEAVLRHGGEVGTVQAELDEHRTGSSSNGGGWLVTVVCHCNSFACLRQLFDSASAG